MLIRVTDEHNNPKFLNLLNVVSIDSLGSQTIIKLSNGSSLKCKECLNYFGQYTIDSILKKFSNIEVSNLLTEVENESTEQLYEDNFNEENLSLSNLESDIKRGRGRPKKV